jgi:hypothetical protein
MSDGRVGRSGVSRLRSSSKALDETRSLYH